MFSTLAVARFGHRHQSGRAELFGADEDAGITSESVDALHVGAVAANSTGGLGFGRGVTQKTRSRIDEHVFDPYATAFVLHEQGESGGMTRTAGLTHRDENTLMES